MLYNCRRSLPCLRTMRNNNNVSFPKRVKSRFMHQCNPGSRSMHPTCNIFTFFDCRVNNFLLLPLSPHLEKCVKLFWCFFCTGVTHHRKISGLNYKNLGIIFPVSLKLSEDTFNRVTVKQALLLQTTSFNFYSHNSKSVSNKEVQTNWMITPFYVITSHTCMTSNKKNSLLIPLLPLLC